MQKKIKKLIALICIASILVTSYPIISRQTVKADALGVSEFSRVFWSLGGSFGLKPNTNNTGSKFLGNLMDMYGRSFDVWMQVDKHRREDLQDVQSWQDLINSNLQTFTRGMAKSFSHFVCDVKSGLFDNELNNNNVESAKTFNSFFNADKKVVFDSLEGGQQYGIHIGDVNKLPTLNPDENGGCPNDDTITAINNRFALNSQYYFWGSHDNGWINFYAVEPSTHTFLFLDTDKTVKMYTDSDNYYQARYWNYNTPVAVSSLEITKNAIKNKPLGLSRFRFYSFSSNMGIRVFEDGSALIFDPALVQTDNFSTVPDSILDQIEKSGTTIDDWAIADENGKTIDDPESKILEKIYKNMLTADDIKALQNGDTSVLDKIDGMTAVNEKTGETVGDIKDEVQDQTGILGGIKAIGRTIASRVLTIVNLIRNLHQRKWTAVIDNVGDIALPIVGSIESLQGIARAIQASKWVIDNVGDITKPLTTALDNVGDLVMEKIKTVSIAIDNVNANLSTVISGCQTKVINGIKTLSDTASSTLENIKSIPKSIATSVAGAFVPTTDDMDAIHTRMNTLCVEHFGVTGKELSISIPEKKFSSIYYKKKKIVDADVLNSGIDKIRPVVQGLMWFFMLLFAINQVLELFDKKGVGDSGDS